MLYSSVHLASITYTLHILCTNNCNYEHFFKYLCKYITSYIKEYCKSRLSCLFLRETNFDAMKTLCYENDTKYLPFPWAHIWWKDMGTRYNEISDFIVATLICKFSHTVWLVHRGNCSTCVQRKQHSSQQYWIKYKNTVSRTIYSIYIHVLPTKHSCSTVPPLHWSILYNIIKIVYVQGCSDNKLSM